MLRLLPLLFAGAASAADLPYVNFEDHPVHALDLSPDHRLLAVAHTADQRVQLFDVSTGEAIAIGSVVVGVDPVSVRFRSNDELWAVNVISDSVSVVDVPGRRVKATLATGDEPYDVVFAGGRAFVSCSQANKLQVFDPARLDAAPVDVALAAQTPRALAVSPDGRSVYAAMFFSGNATTLLAGGLAMNNAALPNVVSDPRGPYGGRNPPPNAGASFDPPIGAGATPPAVGLIVRRGADGHWRDDNAHDWTELVSGANATASGRVPGWTIPDRDLAIVDATTLAVRYVSGLLTTGMALAVNPATGDALLVGTDAHNEVRFEPKVDGRFVRVELMRVPPDGGAKTRVDLNPQLDSSRSTIDPATRDRAIGDPRAIAMAADGRRGYVAGLGSNNVIEIDAAGARSGEPIAVGQGPAGLALDEPHGRLYVWNHFDATLSTIDTATRRELARAAVFNPLPAAIRAGRPFLYDTHASSGLGQAACASCHVDARNDKLAWDLGDPSAPVAPFDQNCLTTILVQTCQPFAAMKGPMTTQTLQDIVGHEPFHWRGDRAGIEAFNPAFEGLLGNDRRLTSAEMQRFEDFLATLAFPPNPYRAVDNTLPASLPLPGQYTSGRFSLAGQPLPNGNAQRGLELYTRGLLDPPFHCASCHTLPTGMAVNGPLFLGQFNVTSGGTAMASGPLGENHLGIVSVDGSTNVSIKVPQLRNEYQKVGFDLARGESLSGFGFLHDGSVDSLSRFVSARNFDVKSDQDVADLVALMMSFAGSDFPAAANPVLGGPAPSSKDAHAAVGRQVTITEGASSERLAQLTSLARAGAIDLVAHAGASGFAFDRAVGTFAAADGSAATLDALLARASAAAPLTFTAVPKGLASRLGVDRDGDGVGDAAEIAQGSDPADAASTTLRPSVGLWFDPARSGHGFDYETAGANAVLTWYTYADDGTPVWYQAVGAAANPFEATLSRYVFEPSTRRVAGTNVGSVRVTFAARDAATFEWTLGSRRGSESVVPLASRVDALPDRTGTWYDAADAGWGVSVFSAGAATRIAVVYFYDGANQPRWTLGQGDAGAAGVALRSYAGFCPDCSLQQTTSVEAGTLSLSFATTRAGNASLDTFDPRSASAHWRRGPTAIVPLTDEPFHPDRR